MKPLSLWQFFKRFPDEEAAVRFIESRRWPDDPACPHCNSAESMWAVLNRQYIGTHHWISFKHLHRYLHEFAARLNGLHGSGVCLAAIVRGAEGKRLTYSELVG